METSRCLNRQILLFERRPWRSKQEGSVLAMPSMNTTQTGIQYIPTEDEDGR